MKKVADMTQQEKLTEIAYHMQAIENLKGKVPDIQYYQEKDRRNKRIKDLGGKEI